MADKLATAYVDIVANSGSLRPGLNQSKNDINSFVNDIVGLLAQVKAAMAGLGFLNFSSKLTAEAEQVSAAMETIIGNAAETNMLIKEMKDFSDVTPFTPQAITKSGRLLLAFGSQVGDVTKELKTLGDLSAGSGSRIGEVALVFAQIRAEGKLLTQDYRQLASRGINLQDTIVETLGIQRSEFRKYMSDGKISFDVVREAMEKMTTDGGAFAGAMEKQSKTLNGLLSTLEGRWNDIGKSVGNRVNPAYKLLVQVLIKAADLYLKIDESTSGLLSGTIALGVGVSSLALGYSAASIAVAKYNLMTTAATVATKSMAVAANLAKLGLVGLAAGGLAVFLLHLRGTFKDLKDFNNELAKMRDLDNRLIKFDARVNRDAFKEAAETDDLTEKERILTNALEQQTKQLGELKHSAKEAKDELTREQDRFRNSSSGGLKLIEGAEEGFKQATARVSAMRENIDQLKEAIGDVNSEQEKYAMTTSDLEKELIKLGEHVGLTSNQIKLLEFADRGATPAQLMFAQAAMESADALKEEEEAAREAARTKEQNEKTVRGLLDNLRQQVSVYGEGAVAVDLYRAKVAGATAEQLKAIEAYHAELDALKKVEEQKKKAKQVIADNRTDDQKFFDEVSELEQMFARGDLSRKQTDLAIERAKSQFNKDIGNEAKLKIKPEFVGLQDFNAKIQDALSGDEDDNMIDKQQLEKLAEQARLQVASVTLLASIDDKLNPAPSTRNV